MLVDILKDMKVDEKEDVLEFKRCYSITVRSVLGRLKLERKKLKKSGLVFGANNHANNRKKKIQVKTARIEP